VWDRVRPWLSRADAWGAVLIALGVLDALGTWLDKAGPLGRALDGAGEAAGGVLALTIPVVLAGLGVALLRRPESAPRLAAAGVLAAATATGLVHLIKDPGVDRRSAGGWLGATVGEPLRSLLGTGAAVLVLAVALAAALLVLTRTSPKQAFAGVRTGVGAIGAGVLATLHWLGLMAERPGGESDEEELEEDDPPPLDVADEELDEEEYDEEDADLEPEPVAEVEEPPAAPVVDIRTHQGPWKLPPLSLLPRGAAGEVDAKEVERAGRTLERALAAHGVETRLVGKTVGPTVTRFELELGPGVKVAKVTNLHKDIAYAMASPDVRILAPIPGRSAIGVEVPNASRQLVTLGDILDSDEARRAQHPLEVALGRDIGGRSVMANLAEMPHLLIAGATGAGKSSCINSLLTSIILRSTPEQVRLILVDPKRVELGAYNGLPHLLSSVVVNPKKAANALSWAVKEMERRYDLLSEVGVRDISGYNAAFDRGELPTEPRVVGVDDPGEPVYRRLPYILVVVDELNDLMMVAARDVEESICRIAQMARAVGIHLVIATQRPSVDVITGVIKANVPARMAFAVSSLHDSRVILDQPGAERLVGRGDMLLLGPASSHPRRVQGSWTGEEEVRGVVAHWKRQVTNGTTPEGGTVPEEDLLLSGGGGGAGGGGGDDDDELLAEAMELVVRTGLGSTSMLQRKLRVGFARAGRLMDLLEQRGVVGPSTGSKARDVLMTAEELDEALTRTPG
jgi:S-DNA-T family DNA segregation ATPase FtsK/SpoIIIE